MSNKLVVMLHAYTSSQSKMSGLKTFIQELIPEAKIIVPQLPISLFSTKDLYEIVSQIISKIDQEYIAQNTRGKELESIILIGHSLGGILARQTLLTKIRSEELSTNSISWSNKVERLILFAGMNRGWSVDTHLSFTQKILWNLGAIVGVIFESVTRKKLLIFKVKKGSEFITNLRLDWIKYFKDRTPVIQLLGSVDDIVSPNDNIDNIVGHNFIYIDIPSSGHSNVIDVTNAHFGPARKKIIREAVLLSIEALSDKYDQANNISDVNPDLSVTDVVFVIHGIRDKGFWTQKLARKVIKTGLKNNRNFKSETSSYGYFPLLPFVIPWLRQKKVHWLMEQYCKNKVLYPNAKFSYIGHSNGTHLLAHALTNYKNIKFENVVFAGSVVNHNFNWQTFIKEEKVKKVKNFVASNDLVVATFPYGFAKWGSKQLGGAGHIGFQIKHKNVINIGKVNGGHSSALEEPFWDSIAKFIVTGTKDTNYSNLVKGHSILSKFLGLISFASIIIILIVLIWIFHLINYQTQEWNDGARILAFIVYLIVIWNALNKM